MQRYNDFHSYSLKTYGKKTARLTVDGGFTCPNRDGTVGVGGCAFCAAKPQPVEPIGVQFTDQMKKAMEKWGENLRFVAYFSAFTNTYESPEKLKERFEEAILLDVDGLMIATRGDCLSAPVLDILEEMSKRLEVIVELGMQTTNEHTILAMNRGYSHKTLEYAVDALQARNIPVLLHLIIGYPGETMDDWMESISFCNEKKVHGIKIHSLFLEKGAALTRAYEREPFSLLSKEDYEEAVAEIIPHLHKDIVIHRLTGDPDREQLVAPLWARDKLRVISGIRKKLKDKKVKQGEHYEKNN